MCVQRVFVRVNLRITRSVSATFLKVWFVYKESEIVQCHLMKLSWSNFDLTEEKTRTELKKTLELGTHKIVHFGEIIIQIIALYELLMQNLKINKIVQIELFQLLFLFAQQTFLPFIK